MSLSRKASSLLTSTLTSSLVRNGRRQVAELSRRLRREPHVVHYFHQVDDPYSCLAAQVLPELARRYEIRLVPHLVGPPPDDAAPERQLLEHFARKDAADVAPHYGLKLPREPANPAPAIVGRANQILASVDAAEFVERAADISACVFGGQPITGAPPGSDSADVARMVSENEALRRAWGHYLGATFYYGGEWYWGIDRLHYLEERLRQLGIARETDGATGAIAPPPPISSAARGATATVTLEYFGSLRSPYSYISMERVYALGARSDVELKIRPVLPMVMRGLPVPLAKRLYIVLDAKREADRLGIPFGNICDPVGEPVERAFGLWRWARSEGREAEFLLAFARAAFAEGIDTGSDEGMRQVVERAGLDWAVAQRNHEPESWRPELEANREEMFALGLWGVPSFRVQSEGDDDFCTWGQDRLWLVAKEIDRRAEKTPENPPSP